MKCHGCGNEIDPGWAIRLRLDMQASLLDCFVHFGCIDKALKNG